MSDKSVRVEVHGLKELNRAFKDVDESLPKSLRLELKKLADSLSATVRGKYPVLTGRAASSVRPRASQRGAAIAYAGPKAEYAPWLEFGGSVGKGRVSGRGGSVKRPIVREGRYLYPTIRENSAEIMEAVDEAVKVVVKKAGFETKGGE